MKTFLNLVIGLIPFLAAQGQITARSPDPRHASLKSIDGKITILQQPQNDTTCLGGTATFEVKVEDSGHAFYDWKHNGSYVEDGYYPRLIIENVEYADTGSYSCILSNTTNDTAYTNTVRLIIREVPLIHAVPEGPESVSYTGQPEVYRVHHHESVTAYRWNLIPGSAGMVIKEIDSLMVDDSIAYIYFDRDFTGTALLYVEMFQGNCRTQNSDTLAIQVSGIPETPEICIVGMDETSEKCRLVWNKTPVEDIAFYNIYRESNMAGIFLKIDSVPVDGPGIYVDSTSVPYVQPHSYRISVTDINGNESLLSGTHTTMLLSSSLGTQGSHNLSWTHYLGYPFPTYKIYQGASKDSMTYLTSVASSVNSYIVQDPPSGLVYYQIAARREGCSPMLKSETDYGETRSNVALLTTEIETPAEGTPVLELIPNPAARRVRII